MEPSVSQHFCLRWNNYRTHLTTVFDQLLRHELFVDVTLAVDGHCQIKAHKVILSACSPFFRSVLSQSQCDHPLIIIRGVTGSEMLALVQFMYRGEISVAQEQLPALLKVAEMLKVRGLTEVADDDDDDDGDGDDDNVVEDGDEVEEEEGVGDGELARSCGNNRAAAAAVVTHLGETDSAAAARDVCDETRRFVSPESLVPETSLDYPMSNSSDVPCPDSASSGNASDSSPSSPGQAATVIAITSVPSVTVSRTSLNSRPSVSVIRVRSPLAHSPPLCMSTDDVEPFRAMHSHPPPSTTGPPPAAALERSQGGPVETAQQRFIKSVSRQLTDEVEIRPAIAEMIKEEERAKMLERAASWTRSPETSFQHQLQRAWQKSWNQHQGIMQNVRFRERGPLKTWRPETMAEAILCVLREGQSLSQAARKFDIPYPTFVLYANRVHNMLGPSLDNSGELRPKGRGRPQRILLGNWPDTTVHSVIRAVVFRDTRALKQHMTHGTSSSSSGGGGRAQQQQPPPLRAQLSASGHLAPTAQRPTVPQHPPATSHYPFPMLPLAAAAAHHSTPPLSAATAAAAAAAVAAGNAGNHANLLGLHNLHMMMGLLGPTAMLPPSAPHMSTATHTGDTASRIGLPSIVNLSNHFPASNSSGSGNGATHSASETMTAAPSLLSTTSATHPLSLSLSRALSSRTLADTYISPAPISITTTETAEAAAGMSHNTANGSLNYQLSHAMNATDLSRATATANTAAAAAAAAATVVSCDPELIDLTERTTATAITATPTTATCRQPAETPDFHRHWTSDAAFSGAISAAPSSGDLANHSYNHRQQHQYGRQDCQPVMSHNLTVASSNQMADYDDEDDEEEEDDDDETTDGAPLALAETVLSFDDNMEPDNDNDNVSDAGGGGDGGGGGGRDNVQTIAANNCAVSGDSFSLAAGQSALPDIRAISSVHLATLQASP